MDPALAEAAKRTAVIAIDCTAFSKTLPEKLSSRDQELLRPLTSADGLLPSQTNWRRRAGRLLLVALLLALLVVCGEILIG